MMLDIITSIHLLLNLIAICTGAVVLFGLLTGELLRKWSIWFLEASLLASISSLTSSAYHFQAAEQASMLSVYLAGVAILAWRWYHLADVWSSVFAATVTMVLYLNIFVAIADAFEYIGALKALAQSHSMNILLVMHALVAVFFVMLGTRAVKRFHSKPPHSF